MNRLILTASHNHRLVAFHDGRRIVSINVLSDTACPSTGDIYLGRVRDVRINLNACFVELDGAHVGYLKTDKEQCFNPGDRVCVQVEKEASGTKEAGITTRLSRAGRYVVATEYPGRIAVSSRITDTEERTRLKEMLQPYAAESGFIVRTNAGTQDAELIAAEAEALSRELKDIRKRADYSTEKTVLYRAEPLWASAVRDMPAGQDCEIVTDDPGWFQEIEDYRQTNREIVHPLRLYADSFVSLSALYSLDTVISSLEERRIWLKSGGLLVIDPTEAMTVIDVNSGKSEKKAQLEEAAFALNLEAADEICAQLRLRNISGIILVDFVNMKEAGHREELRTRMTENFRKDPVKTVFVDFTQLGLAEITRKKIHPPVLEQLRRN